MADYAAPCAANPPYAGSRMIAVEQLDRYPFGPADEADAHARPHRGGRLGELDPLGLEVGRDGIDAADREPEMIEALVGRGGCRVDAVARRHRRDEDIGAAQLQV